MQNSKTAIMWFTNNLRINDNESLQLATHLYERVIAVYCINPNHFKKSEFGFIKTGKYRTQFLLETLTDLKIALKKLNIPFIVDSGHPHKVLSDHCKSYYADALFFQKEFTKEETDEINLVKKNIPTNVKVFEQYDQFLFHPEDIPFQFDKIPSVFGDFRRKIEKYSSVKQLFSPKKKSDKNYSIQEFSIPTLASLGFNDFEIKPNSAFPFSGGETAALNRLNDYFFNTKKVAFYKQTRNGLVGVDYSSKFSSWLANGSISAKTIYWKLKKFENEYGSNQSTYWIVFELLWRDFFKYTAMKYKNNLFSVTGILNKDYQCMDDENKINQWVNGETLEPFVNANMIELKETGWMSNRGRQNVASYFAKELQLDWRIGASYFESMLIDYDVHSNYGNWQYLAGIGNDPRDRKFNIKLQAERYDSNHKYRNLWLQPTLF